MQRIATILTFTTLLFACGRNDDVHEYQLLATVLQVLKCDKQKETCIAKVYKGENAQYSEIWTIADFVKKGDRVHRTCRFQIAKNLGDDKSKSAGLSSRSTVEKELNNANCDKYGHSS